MDTYFKIWKKDVATFNCQKKQNFHPKIVIIF